MPMRPSTPTHPIRIPNVMWDTYARICERLGTTRTGRLLDHIRADIREHGDQAAIEALEQGEQELAERRARMHPGRPRKT